MKRRRQKERTRNHQAKMRGRNKMCDSKKSYDTLDEADGYAVLYSDPRYNKLGVDKDFHSYLCPHCNKFHLTTRAKKKCLTNN